MRLGAGMAEAAGLSSGPEPVAGSEVTSPLTATPRGLGDGWAHMMRLHAAPSAQSVSEGVHNWHGAYGALLVGANKIAGRLNIDCDDPAGTFDGSPDCRDSLYSGALINHYSMAANDLIAGVQAGYNVQHGELVIGFEADVSGTPGKVSDEYVSERGGLPREESITGQDIEWFATVRARFGFVSGNLLTYATGGLALAGADHGYTLSLPGLDSYAHDVFSKTLVGWTLGSGIEYGMGRWSLKGEYLYYDLGSEKGSTQWIVAGAPTGARLGTEFETRGVILRAGASFKLD